MDRNQARHWRKMIIRYFVPYVTILLVSSLIGLFTYDRTLKLVEAEVINTNMALLEQSKKIADIRLSEIEAVAQQIVLHPKVISYQYVKNAFDGTNAYRTIEARKALLDFTTSNQLLNDYFLMFKNSEVILQENKTYLFPLFYEHIFRYENMDYEEWKDLFLKQYHRGYLPAMPVTYQGGTKSYITYVQSIGYLGNSNGVVVMLIDAQQIHDLLSGLDLSDGGWAYITDKEGQIITSVSPDKGTVTPFQLDSLSSSGMIPPSNETNQMMITYTTSDFNDWIYIAAQPAHIVLEKAQYIKRISISILLIQIITGVVIALILAYRNSKPIRKLMYTIMERFEGENQASGDVFGLIDDTLSRLFHTNDELQTKIKKQLPYIRRTFFELLLNGELQSQQEIKNLSQHIGITLNGKHYVVAIFYLRGYRGTISKDVLEDRDMKRVITYEVIKQTFGEQCRLHESGADKILMLYISQISNAQDGKMDVNDLFQQVSDELYNRHHIQSIIAVGHLYHNLMDISKSYEEAKQALEFKIWKGNKEVIWYEDLPKNINSYYFPGEVETKLMNFAKAGDQQVVEDILKSLQRENFEVRHLSFPVLQLFIYEMWGSLIKLYEQTGLKDHDVYEQIKSSITNMDSLEELSNHFRNIELKYFSICEWIHQRKKSNNTELIQDILKYLEVSYKETGLCLAQVAEYFKISEVYLSHFFKEQTGVNFSDYLESTRMNQAKILLENSKIPVNQIANHIGYNSSNAFIRAFKRSHGITPAVYRSDRSR